MNKNLPVLVITFLVLIFMSDLYAQTSTTVNTSTTSLGHRFSAQPSKKFAYDFWLNVQGISEAGSPSMFRVIINSSSLMAFPMAAALVRSFVGFSLFTELWDKIAKNLWVLFRPTSTSLTNDWPAKSDIRSYQTL